MAKLSNNKFTRVVLNDSDSINSILNEFTDKIDNFSIILDSELNKCIREARRIDPDCADDLEKEFSKLHSDVRFGSILSTYIKVNVIRPIQKKYNNKL